MYPVDPDRLRVALATAALTRQELALRLGLPPSTLGSWLRGVAPAPPDLAARIECALGLEPGALSPSPVTH